MKPLLRTALLGTLATAGFAAVVSALAPERLRRPAAAPRPGPAVEDEVDADDLTPAEALALLREFAFDLDTATLDPDDEA